MLIPRDYQTFAADCFFRYYEQGNTGNPIIASPVGTGKSLIIADITTRIIKNNFHLKVLILTHVKELISQDYDKLTQYWPEAPAGIFSAGLNRKEFYYPITFAGIDSIFNFDLTKFGRIDLVIVDECHLISPKEETMYRQVFNSLLELNPAMKVLGLTATPYRSGHGILTNEGHIFTDICCDMTSRDSFNWFIDQGYLVNLIPKKANIQVDTSKVTIRAGEFVDKEAQAAFDKEEITYKACKEIRDIADVAKRKHILVFASGIEHATHVKDMLIYFGFKVGLVHSKMKVKERDSEIQKFVNGEYECLVNNGILTTGFDYPSIDMLAILRMTNSTNLWVQILGRGVRPDYMHGFDLSTSQGRLAAIANSEKPNCIVLDFAQNAKRLGKINNPVIPVMKGGKKTPGDAPVKLCPACDCYNHAAATVCEYCGAEMPREMKLKEHASLEELVERDNSVKESVGVDRIIYKKVQRGGKQPFLRVEYYCSDKKKHVQMVFLEHDGYPGKLARDWWRGASGTFKYPRTIDEAMQQLAALRKPKFLTIKTENEISEIYAYEY